MRCLLAGTALGALGMVVLVGVLVALPRCGGGAKTGADGGLPALDGGGSDGGTGGGTDGGTGGGADGGLDGGAACQTGTGAGTGSVSYTGAFPTTSGESDVTLTLSGLARQVFLYVPSSRGSSPPLLIALHGTGSGTDVGQGRDFGSQFEAMADAQGIIVAAPESRVQPDADWDQHSGGEKYWETQHPDDPSRGCDPDRNPDLLLVRAILQEARRAYNVDPKRVYVAGFSNGGFFSLHVAVALRQVVAAFAELSAGLVRCDNTNSCSFGGTSTTCAGLAAEPDYCSCNGSEKPIPLPTSGRMPPGYISHGNQDYTVSVVYSCDLANRMAQLGHTAQVTIRGGEDHIVPDFTQPAVYGALWTFFDQNRLP